MYGHQTEHHAVVLRALAFAHSTHLLSFAEPITNMCLKQEGEEVKASHAPRWQGKGGLE